MKSEYVPSYDPGELTLEELKKLVTNPDFTPFWEMHPIVKMVIFIAVEVIPKKVETICGDNDDWRQCFIGPGPCMVSAMTFEPKRINPDAVDWIFKNYYHSIYKRLNHWNEYRLYVNRHTWREYKKKVSTNP